MTGARVGGSATATGMGAAASRIPLDSAGPSALEGRGVEFPDIKWVGVVLETDSSRGVFGPKEIAIERANEASGTALADAVQRTRTPARSRTPSLLSKTVAATAQDGMVARGRNERSRRCR